MFVFKQHFSVDFKTEESNNFFSLLFFADPLVREHQWLRSFFLFEEPFLLPSARTQRIGTCLPSGLGKHLVERHTLDHNLKLEHLCNSSLLVKAFQT
jgi:hypothetical protein